jgi:hypothetical protein
MRRVAEELGGDLNDDTNALAGKKFDVVIDNPTTAAGVRNAAKHPAGNTKHYMFISTTSVDSDQSAMGIDEQSPTTRCRRTSMHMRSLCARSGDFPTRFRGLSRRSHLSLRARHPR